MASAAAETLASLTIAPPSRSLLRPLPRRAAAGGRAASIRLSAVPPRGLGFALIHRRIRCPPAARANVESDGDGADASGLGEASSAGDGDMVTLWPAFSQELGGRAARSGGAAEACGSRPVAGSGGGFFLRFDPRDVFLPEDALTSPDPSAAAEFLQRLVHPPDSAATTVPGDFTFRDRFLLRDPTDALALPGLLVLPQSFGAIHLGETFCSYISINNSSSFEAREVIINVRTIKNETLIAIKAPHGSRLEVPDPDEAGDYLQRRYRIVIRSTMGSIDLYLVSKFEEKMEELIGVATTPRHANVAKPGRLQNNRSWTKQQTEGGVAEYSAYIQKTPDLNASHDFGGMTRITPDVDLKS